MNNKMSNLTKAYKVLNLTPDNILTSAITHHKPAIVVYHKNTTIVAPKHFADHGYNLCVFSELHHASCFITLDTFPQKYTHVIWEVKGALTPIRRYRCSLPFSTGEIHPINTLRPVGAWPVGTMMMSKLKLVRQVWPL